MKSKNVLELGVGTGVLGERIKKTAPDIIMK